MSNTKYQIPKKKTVLEIGNSLRGFTIPELLITLTLISALLALATITLTTSSQNASVDSALTTIIADIKNQQLNAMTGFTQSEASASEFGIYFENNQYTLFKGNAYTPGNTTNAVVPIHDSIELSTIDLPAYSIIFGKLSGEITGFDTNANTITFHSIPDNKTVILKINRYGAVTQAI